MPETSARLPALTNVERPRPRARPSPGSPSPARRTGRRSPARPRGGISAASEALSETAGSVLMMPRALGPISRSAVGARQPDQPPLPLPALLARLGEAGGDDDQAVHALGRAVEHDVGDRVRGHGDDRHVDVVRDVADDLYAGMPGHRRRAGVDRVDPTGEVAGDQVADQRLADGVLAAAGADDRDRARVEEPVDRGGLGLVLTVRHGADQGVGGVDRELEAQHAVVVLADDPVARVPEGLDHRLVVREHLGDEAVEAALAGRLRQVLEQDLGDAAALVLVLDEERDLGLPRLDDVVAADRDHPGLEEDARTRPGPRGRPR